MKSLFAKVGASPAATATKARRHSRIRLLASMASGYHPLPLSSTDFRAGGGFVRWPRQRAIAGDGGDDARHHLPAAMLRQRLARAKLGDAGRRVELDHHRD